MRESIVKNTVLRVPVEVTVARDWQRGASWSAEVTRKGSGSWLRVDGASEADARAELTATILAALAARDESMVMVIGGSEDHADYMHLIQAMEHGVTVYRVNVVTGRLSCTSSGSGTVDEQLKRTLEHVGGDPKIVRL